MVFTLVLLSLAAIPSASTVFTSNTKNFTITISGLTNALTSYNHTFISSSNSLILNASQLPKPYYPYSYSATYLGNDTLGIVSYNSSNQLHFFNLNFFNSSFSFNTLITDYNLSNQNFPISVASNFTNFKSFNIHAVTKKFIENETQQLSSFVKVENVTRKIQFGSPYWMQLGKDYNAGNVNYSLLASNTLMNYYVNVTGLNLSSQNATKLYHFCIYINKGCFNTPSNASNPTHIGVFNLTPNGYDLKGNFSVNLPSNISAPFNIKMEYANNKTVIRNFSVNASALNYPFDVHVKNLSAKVIIVYDTNGTKNGDIKKDDPYYIASSSCVGNDNLQAGTCFGSVVYDQNTEITGIVNVSGNITVDSGVTVQFNTGVDEMIAGGTFTNDGQMRSAGTDVTTNANNVNSTDYVSPCPTLDNGDAGGGAQGLYIQASNIIAGNLNFSGGSGINGTKNCALTGTSGGYGQAGGATAAGGGSGGTTSSLNGAAGSTPSVPALSNSEIQSLVLGSYSAVPVSADYNPLAAATGGLAANSVGNVNYPHMFNMVSAYGGSGGGGGAVASGTANTVASGGGGGGGLVILSYQNSYTSGTYNVAGGKGGVAGTGYGAGGNGGNGQVLTYKWTTPPLQPAENQPLIIASLKSYTYPTSPTLNSTFLNDIKMTGYCATNDKCEIEYWGQYDNGTKIPVSSPVVLASSTTDVVTYDNVLPAGSWTLAAVDTSTGFESANYTYIVSSQNDADVNFTINYDGVNNTVGSLLTYCNPQCHSHNSSSLTVTNTAKLKIWIHATSYKNQLSGYFFITNYSPCGSLCHSWAGAHYNTNYTNTSFSLPAGFHEITFDPSNNNYSYGAATMAVTSDNVSGGKTPQSSSSISTTSIPYSTTTIQQTCTNYFFYTSCQSSTSSNSSTTTSVTTTVLPICVICSNPSTTVATTTIPASSTTIATTSVATTSIVTNPIVNGTTSVTTSSIPTTTINQVINGTTSILTTTIPAATTTISKSINGTTTVTSTQSNSANYASCSPCLIASPNYNTFGTSTTVQALSTIFGTRLQFPNYYIPLWMIAIIIAVMTIVYVELNRRKRYVKYENFALFIIASFLALYVFYYMNAIGLIAI